MTVTLVNGRWAGIAHWALRLTTDRNFRDRIPVETRFSAPVQTGPGAYLASSTNGTGS